MITHIEVGRVGAMSDNGMVQVEHDIVASVTLAAAGSTSFSNLPAGDLFVTITSDTNIWFNIGTGTPTANADPRRFTPALGAPRSFPFAVGSQVAVATS